MWYVGASLLLECQEDNMRNKGSDTQNVRDSTSASGRIWRRVQCRLRLVGAASAFRAGLDKEPKRYSKIAREKEKGVSGIQ